MEALWLLAKINVIFQVTEKLIYVGLGLFGVVTVVKYTKDYKESVEDEKYAKRR